MMRPGSSLRRLRPLLLPAACALWCGYFAWGAVMGETGLLAWGGYKAERTRLEAEAAQVRARRAATEHRVALLDPRHVDRDLADELVRRQLGMIRKDEVELPLHPGD